MIHTALTSGLLGAIALTVLHETTRRSMRNAPRMDVLGERAIMQGFRAAGYEPPVEPTLHNGALAGDIVANSLYYSLVGIAGANAAPATGAFLGLVAGVGAVTLPGPFGLGSEPANRTKATTATTVGLYLAGGLAAGIAYCIGEHMATSES